jgi:hypothetical protein
LGRELHEVKAEELMKFMCDPSALAEFVIQRMPALLEWEGPVTQALALT